MIRSWLEIRGEWRRLALLHNLKLGMRMRKRTAARVEGGAVLIGELGAIFAVAYIGKRVEFKKIAQETVGDMHVVSIKGCLPPESEDHLLLRNLHLLRGA